MPLIARQRSRLATLAVLALVGSLLAVSAAPAAAAGDDKVTYPAKFSACVGGATADAGYEDMIGSYAEAAVNCLAYYGITYGTAPGQYSPSQPITRRQMALFLSRAAGPAGVVLDAATDQGITDIGGLSEADQAVVNQMVAAGIMAADGMMFNPGGPVLRRDMAVHLATFLDHAIRGPGGTDIGETTAAKNGIVAANVDDVFGDVSGVPYSAWTAIRNLYEMGVIAGAANFNPNASVTRSQMAAFVTRALNHTNVRPAGLSAQADKGTDVFKGDTVAFVTSVRDDSFMPSPGALVDVFWKTGDEARTTAFKDDGTCVTSPTGGTTPCEITAADYATDANGNLESGISHTIGTTATSSPVVVWVWTGNVGDKFDNDETASEPFDLMGAEQAANWELSTDLPENASSTGRDTSPHAHDDHGYAQLKYGSTLTITLQLIDANGDPVAKKDQSITVRVQKKVDEGDDLDTADWSTNAESSSDQSMTYKTNESGTVALMFTEDDPNSGTGMNDATRIQVTFTGEAPGQLQDSAGQSVDTVNYEWNDDAAQPTKVTVKFPKNYTAASNVGSGASGSVQAVLSDQYGDPVGSKKMSFLSTADGGVGATALNRYTGTTDGLATLGFNRANAAAHTERISVTHIIGCLDSESDCSESNDLTGSGDFIWTTQADAAGGLTVVDKDNNTLVVGTNAGTYDSNDFFFVGGDNTAGNATTMEKFEAALAVGKVAQWTYVADGTSFFRVATA